MRASGRTAPLRFREVILLLVIVILSVLLIFSNVFHFNRSGPIDSAASPADGARHAAGSGRGRGISKALDSLESAVGGHSPPVTKGKEGNVAAAALSCPTCAACPTCPTLRAADNGDAAVAAVATGNGATSADGNSEGGAGDAISPPPYVLHINVFTYNRLDGLKRLLKSLKESFYPNVDPRSGQLPMTIYFDYPAKKDMALDGTRAFLDAFHWPFGPLTIHRRERNVGLKKNIMEAWYPSANGLNDAADDDDAEGGAGTMGDGDDESPSAITRLKEYASFFEDDIEVSPYWFVWADKGIRTYSSAFVGVTEENKKLLGLSLYRCVKDEMSFSMVRFEDDGNKPFLLQQPSSWGAVYFPQLWRQFRRWGQAIPADFDITVNDPRDPAMNPSSNTWPSASSWKKYLIYLMYTRGWYMVYPNLPNRTVLSTNHLMKGVHPTPNRALYELPLFPPEGMMSPEALAELQQAYYAKPKEEAKRRRKAQKGRGSNKKTQKSGDGAASPSSSSVAVIAREDPLALSPPEVGAVLMQFPPLSAMTSYDVMHGKRGRGPSVIPNNRVAIKDGDTGVAGGADGNNGNGEVQQQDGGGRPKKGHRRGY